MKIQIQRSALLEALKKIQGIAPGKGTLPVLQNVLFETGDGKVTLTTSDLDVTMRAEAICEVTEEGRTTIPVKLLSAAVSKLAEGTVKITVGANDKADVVSGNTKFKIAGVKAEEFPRLPGIPADAAKYVIKAKDLKDMLGKVRYAASQDDTRKTLQGTLISFKGGTATVVSTDGRRLALVKREMDVGGVSEFSVIIPKKTVGVLMGELGGDGDVEMVMGGSQIVIRLDGMTVYSKLFDDAYPNYGQVIPKETKYTIPIDRIALLEALDRVSVLSESSDAKSVKLHFEQGMLTIKSNAADIGEATDELAVKYDGEEMDAMFNASYMMDALKVIADDVVSFSMNDGTHPVVLKDSKDFLYVLMPLRIC